MSKRMVGKQGMWNLKAEVRVKLEGLCPARAQGQWTPTRQLHFLLISFVPKPTEPPSLHRSSYSLSPPAPWSKPEALLS